MVGAPVTPASSKPLQRLFAMLAGSLGETLGALVNTPIVARPGELRIVDADEHVRALAKPAAVARGALDKAFAGRTFAAAFDMADAIAMAGLLMMTPQDVIEQRRAAGVLDGEDAEAFHELGNVLYSGLGNVLREQVADVDIRQRDHGVVRPGLDKDGLLGAGDLVVCHFALQVGDLPATVGAFAVDLATAEAWNKAPLARAGDAPAAAPAAPAAPAEAPAAAAAATGPDEPFESIPEAPIRGRLAAFVGDPKTIDLVRRCCRRVGLELVRHTSVEVPNPAGHRDEIVVIDVQGNEERRIEWCRRVKEFQPAVRIALLLHRPSRQSVKLAFEAKADVILGLPCAEAHLSQRLAALLEPSPAAAT
jgi:hypothetical protein